MSRVFVHPYAGVLSAYGMGLAEIRALRERQVDVPLEQVSAAENVLDLIRKEAEDEVRAQGVAQLSFEQKAYLRYDGSHQALEVPFGDIAAMQAAFEAVHKQRFGFISPERAIMFDMVSAEAIGEVGEVPRGLGVTGGKVEPIAQVTFYAAGTASDAPLYARENLAEGAVVTGPAIISEATGTNVIEAGWEARVDALGNLIIERGIKVQRAAAGGHHCGTLCCWKCSTICSCRWPIKWARHWPTPRGL